MTTPQRPAWVKGKTVSADFQVIYCKEWDDYKDFKMEPSGYYVLIKILWDKGKLAVAVCNSKHEIEAAFEGRRIQDIYTAMFDFEEQNGRTWFTRKDHIAYLGKELKKAEIALAMGNSAYFQE